MIPLRISLLYSQFLALFTYLSGELLLRINTTARGSCSWSWKPIGYLRPSLPSWLRIFRKRLLIIRRNRCWRISILSLKNMKGILSPNYPLKLSKSILGILFSKNIIRNNKQRNFTKNSSPKREIFLLNGLHIADTTNTSNSNNKNELRFIKTSMTSSPTSI